MKNLTDRDYLLRRQYSDASNLESRIALHKRFSTNPQGQPRWFFEHLDILQGERVLEVGCGPASFWIEAADVIPPTWQITLSDFSPGMVAHVQQRLAALDRPFTVVQADVQDLPFPDESFDAVIANFMLYHVPDRQRALAQIHRVLVADGRLFAMTNGRRHMQEFRELVRRVAPDLVRSEESGFSLENGGAQLAPWFEDVRVERYPDALRVTEAEPLLAYLRSYAAGLSGEQEAALRVEIEAELAVHGAITITKDSGLVSGVKRPTGSGQSQSS